MAVLVFGYPPGPAPPMQVNNELVNLQARWDANWYLGIVTEGYHFVPNQPGLQQSIAFFPAYPMLVRGVGRILGGRLTSYIGAGMLVSFAAFFGALVYLYALARDTLDEDEARFALWAIGDVPVRAVLRRHLRRAAAAARDDGDVLPLHARALRSRRGVGCCWSA